MSHKKYLTLESIRNSYFNKGVSLTVAAKELGCSVTVLRNCIHQYGLKPKESTWNREAFMKARYVQPTKLISKEDIERVYTNVKTTMGEAVAALGTSEEVFIRSMRAHGITPKAKNWNKESRRSRYSLLNNIDELRRELETKSMTRLAREIGCTEGAIQYHAKKHNLINFDIDLSSRIKEGMRKSFPGEKFGPDTSNWKGGTKLTAKGYIYTYDPEHPNSVDGGYIMEHRLVMEKHLGRLLTKEEIVHHKNGNKSDNKIENLELVSDRGTHTREHFERSHKTEQLEEALRAIDPNHPLLSK